jgi:vitamin B12 transporter
MWMHRWIWMIMKAGPTNSPGRVIRFKASFCTGFRSPSLYELYSVYGNPDLAPEKSRGWDLGVEQGFLDDHLTLGHI